MSSVASAYHRVFRSYATLALCAVVFAYFNPKLRAVLPALARHAGLDPDAGQAVHVLDEMPGGWDLKVAEQLFAQIGAEGRALYGSVYVLSAGGLDIWTPLSIMATVTWTAHAVVTPERVGNSALYGVFRASHYSALLAWCVDQCENTVIAQLLRAYPFAAADVPALQSLARVGGACTVLKWMLFLVAALSIVATGVIALVRWLHCARAKRAGAGHTADAAAHKSD